jgi:DNA-binding NarL/FixJ family response regulator
VRRGLVALLTQEPDIEVVGEAADGLMAVELAARLQPGVAVLDVRMPGISGVEACSRIKDVSPQTRCLFLTSFADEEALVGAMLVGARGYILKNLAEAGLVDAVRAVARGESVLDPTLGASVASGMRRLASGALRATPTGVVQAAAEPAVPVSPPPAAGAVHSDGHVPPTGLSGTDLVILRALAEGRTNREIAEQTHFAEKTVRNYVSALLAKLHLRNRAEAAAYAVRHDIIGDL